MFHKRRWFQCEFTFIRNTWKQMWTTGIRYPSINDGMSRHVIYYPGKFSKQVIKLQNNTRTILLMDTAMLISELTRFDSFYIFSTELLVFILCRQADKVFRLPWPSFVRVEIYYKYRLSINRKYRLPDRESSIAKWLERWPLGPGVVSSSTGLYLFSLSRIFFYFPV